VFCSIHVGIDFFLHGFWQVCDLFLNRHVVDGGYLYMEWEKVFQFWGNENLTKTFYFAGFWMHKFSTLSKKKWEKQLESSRVYVSW